MPVPARRLTACRSRASGSASRAERRASPLSMSACRRTQSRPAAARIATTWHSRRTCISARMMASARSMSACRRAGDRARVMAGPLVRLTLLQNAAPSAVGYGRASALSALVKVLPPRHPVDHGRDRLVGLGALKQVALLDRILGQPNDERRDAAQAEPLRLRLVGQDLGGEATLVEGAAQRVGIEARLAAGGDQDLRLADVAAVLEEGAEQGLGRGVRPARAAGEGGGLVRLAAAGLDGREAERQAALAPLGRRTGSRPGAGRRRPGRGSAPGRAAARRRATRRGPARPPRASGARGRAARGSRRGRHSRSRRRRGRRLRSLVLSLGRGGAPSGPRRRGRPPRGRPRPPPRARRGCASGREPSWGRAWARGRCRRRRWSGRPGPGRAR